MNHFLNKVVIKMEYLLSGSISNAPQWISAAIAIATVRFFLEALSSPQKDNLAAFIASSYIHSTIFFIAVALVMLVFITYILPQKKDLAPALVIFFLPIIWLPPLIDLAVSGGTGISMKYSFETIPGLMHTFFGFFAGGAQGITTGIRTEIAFITILLSGYIYFITGKIFRTFVGLIGSYALIFILVSLPSFIYIIAGHGMDAKVLPLFFAESVTRSATHAVSLYGGFLYSSFTVQIETGFDFMMGRLLLVISLISGALWLYSYSRIQFLAILKNIRIERLIHYLFAAAVGVFLAFRISPPLSFTWNDVSALVCLAISVIAGWVHAVSTNDIYDMRIDSISAANQNRPLIQGTLNENSIRHISTISLLIAIVSAYLSGYYALFSVIAFIAAYYVYSVPPVRMKRIPIFSSVPIAFANVAIVFGAFFTVSATKEVSAFPTVAIVAVFVLSFLWSHIKDIKDVEGDRAEGIHTLSTILGSTWGPRVTGVLAASVFLLIHFFTKTYFFLLPSLLPAALTYYFAVRRPYDERPLFIVYLGSLVIYGVALMVF